MAQSQAMTAPTPTGDVRAMTVRGLLERSKSQFQLALPKFIDPERFLRVAMTEVQRNPKLLDCTPVSLLASLMECAQLGLQPGVLGQAYLVPYKDKVTLIPGYRGLLALARRSGQLKSLSAHVVYEKDEFDYGLGDEPHIKHRPWKGADHGEVIAVYAIALLADGSKQMELMWKYQIDAHRKRSMSANSGPWVTDYDEMARKTVVRRICKYLPMSVEMIRAMELEETAHLGIPQELPIISIPEAQIRDAEEAAARNAAATAGTAGLTVDSVVGGDRVRQREPGEDDEEELFAEPTAADIAKGNVRR